MKRNQDENIKPNEYYYKRIITICIIFIFIAIVIDLGSLLLNWGYHADYYSSQISFLTDIIVAVPSIFCAVIANKLATRNDNIQSILNRPKFKIDKADLSLEYYDPPVSNQNVKNMSYGEKKYLKSITDRLNATNDRVKNEEKVPKRGIVNLCLKLEPDTQSVIEKITLDKVSIRVVCMDGVDDEICDFFPIENKFSYGINNYIAKEKKRILNWNDGLNSPTITMKMDLIPCMDSPGENKDRFWIKFKGFLDMPHSKDLTIEYLDVIAFTKVKYETDSEEKTSQFHIKFRKSDRITRKGCLFIAETSRGNFLYEKGLEA